MKSTMTTMVLSLTLIAASMGAVLGLVHDATAEPISRAETEARNAALESVLPKCQKDSIGAGVDVTVPGDSRAVMVYPAYEAGNVCGIAVESWTMDGFSGEIDVMVGFASDGRISGYQVLKHAETPGLGAKADEWFRSDVVDGATGATRQCGRSIIGTTGTLSVSKDGGDIDGITAATITSRAFLSAVNRARQACDIWLDSNLNN